MSHHRRVRLAVVAPLVAVVALAGAHVARIEAKSRDGDHVAGTPYAPTPGAAPIVALGYRELAADLLLVRLIGYFGSEDNDASGIADLAEAIVALDPSYRRVYELGSVAMTSAHRGVDNSIHLRAIALLETAARAYPTSWNYPKLAGEIYLVDLKTNDPVQRRAWDEEGSRLLETASRKPGAPATSAMVAATLQSRLGQHQRAVDNLRETLLLTSDDQARAQIIAKLAELTKADSAELAAEVMEERHTFVDQWQAQRPTVTPSMYILVGPPLARGFDLTDLATGGHDVVGSQGFERLEPVTDSPAP